MLWGTISLYTFASRTRRAISCAYCAPKSTTRTGPGGTESRAGSLIDQAYTALFHERLPCRRNLAPVANPTLTEKRFEDIKKDDEAGWAAPIALAHAEAAGGPPPAARVAHMTANGAFAKTFALFLLLLAGG